MAVYTRLEIPELATALAPLRLGRLIAASGVKAGIENTTYFLTFVFDADAAPKEFVLTIAETVSRSELEFIAALTSRLNGDGVPVPQPVAAFSGEQIVTIRGKPALVVPKVRGRHPNQPTLAQCHAVGRALAQCHLSTQRAGFCHEGHRNLKWVSATGIQLLDLLDHANRMLLNRELLKLSTFIGRHPPLPTAVIHGDLFRDNALFDGDELTAIIDFFSAGTGPLMFDLAVSANDWCLSLEVVDQAERLRSLTDGYQSIRIPTPLERRLWPQVLAIAALRFWVSRLADRLLPSDRSSVHRFDKDPDEYRNLLNRHLRTPLDWLS